MLNRSSTAQERPCDGNKGMATIMLSVVLAMLFTGPACAELSVVRAELWNRDFVNADGMQIVPAVAYEAWTGILYTNTLGIDQQLETFQGDVVGGDDVGVRTLEINGPEPDEVLIPIGLLEQNIGDLVVTNTSYFNDTQSLITASFVGSAEFIEPHSRFELFRYRTGLTSSDFSYAAISTLNANSMGVRITGRVQVLPGRTDLNADRQTGCDDIDALGREIRLGSSNLEFDLNGDGAVNDDDRQKWLDDAGEGLLGTPIRLGDANLDGTVNVRDFHIWNAHRFSFSSSFCDGDFNADGVVDVSDYNVWSEYRSNGPPISVPEPSGSVIWIGFLLLPLFTRRVTQ
jgi:hypothetical protein